VAASAELVEDVALWEELFLFELIEGA